MLFKVPFSRMVSALTGPQAPRSWTWGRTCGSGTACLGHCVVQQCLRLLRARLDQYHLTVLRQEAFGHVTGIGEEASEAFSDTKGGMLETAG